MSLGKLLGKGGFAKCYQAVDINTKEVNSEFEQDMWKLYFDENSTIIRFGVLDTYHRFMRLKSCAKSC